MGKLQRSFEVPYRDQVLDSNGVLANAWEWFFRAVVERIYPLGDEDSILLVNNQAAVANVTNLKFNSKGVSQAFVDFLIQRVTTGAGAVELIASGMFAAVYKPTSNTWAIQMIGTPGPSTSGITFSITALGQVQYTSTNETGTASISKLCWRARTLGAKNEKYSSVGSR